MYVCTCKRICGPRDLTSIEKKRSRTRLADGPEFIIVSAVDPTSGTSQSSCRDFRDPHNAMLKKKK